VKVCDRLPRGTKFVAGSLGAKRRGRLVCWSIPTLRARASKSVWVRGEALLGVTGTLRDGATAAASPGGRHLTARASAEVQVTATAPCGSARDAPDLRSFRGPLAVASC
jgi:hypothetical protein